MEEIKQSLIEWLNSINEYKTPRVDSIPDLGLYMDQVTTYIDKAMGPLAENTYDRILTSSMINNYVKGQIVPNPIQKKYSRVHLMYLIVVCTLKQVLPIGDISKVLKNTTEESENYYSYDMFRIAQDDALKRVSSDLLKKLSLNEFIMEEKDLTDLALRLAVDSYATKIVSERILYFMAKGYEKELEEIKQKTIVEEKNKKEEKTKKEENNKSDVLK